MATNGEDIQRDIKGKPPAGGGSVQAGTERDLNVTIDPDYESAITVGELPGYGTIKLHPNHNPVSHQRSLSILCYLSDKACNAALKKYGITNSPEDRERADIVIRGLCEEAGEQIQRIMKPFVDKQRVVSGMEGIDTLSGHYRGAARYFNVPVPPFDKRVMWISKIEHQPETLAHYEQQAKRVMQDVAEVFSQELRQYHHEPVNLKEAITTSSFINSLRPPMDDKAFVEAEVKKAGGKIVGEGKEIPPEIRCALEELAHAVMERERSKTPKSEQVR